MCVTWGSMTRTTNYYQLALDEFMQNNPRKRRVSDITEEDRKKITERAQQLKSLGEK